MESKVDLEKIIEQADQDKKIDIPVPNKLVVSLTGVQGNINADLVGMEAGKYLVTSIPKLDISIRDKLRAGAPLIVKYLHKGSVFAFQAYVLGSITKPVELIFLTFPQIVSRHELRKSLRVDCNLSSRVYWNDLDLLGMVVDLSAGGCCFVSNGLNGNSFDVKPGDEVMLNFHLSDDPNLNKFKGVVRRLNVDRSACLMGVEFAKLDEKQHIFVNGFVRSVEELNSVRERL